MFRKTLVSSVAALALVACGTPASDPELRRTTAALTVSEALSFDDASDWSVSGGTLATSSVKTQGLGSIEVNTSYHTVLGATGLETPASVGDTFSFDLRTDTQSGWGEVRVVLVSAQLNIWTEIGKTYVASLTPNQFHTIEHALSPSLQTALAQSYSDLEVRFIFDAPPARFWLDDGSFGTEGASCTDGVQNGDETGVDCGASCPACETCGNGVCEGVESCSSCAADCGSCGNPECSDGVLNGAETETDCGGACAPCGAAATGILWYDKFSNGLGQWAVNGFSDAALAHTVDYAEPGSGSPAAGANISGSATLTSPSIDLSQAQGVPLLRFQRLIAAPPESVTRLEFKQSGSWQMVRDLSSSNANDNRWRTEFVPLDAYVGVTDFQFRFVTSGAETTFQVDDVSLSDRTRVDGDYVEQSFVMPPGNLSGNQGWEWRISESDTWSGPRSGPFSGDNSGWPTSQPEPPFDLWLRTTVSIDSNEDLEELRFWSRWDDQLEIRVNGVVVVDEDSWSESYQYLEPSTNVFTVGFNTIEVHAHDFGGGRYVDVGLSRDVDPTNLPEAVEPPELTHGGSDPLAGFADRIHDYVLSRAVPGVAFALYKDGARVVEAAYGFRDAALTQPMPLNPVMRLASVDKSFTVAAAAKLIDDGFLLADEQPLTRDTLVFPTLRSLYGFPGTAAGVGPWADEVTVGHLMDHMGHVNNFQEGGNAFFYDTVGSSRGHTTRHDNAFYIQQAGCFRQPGTGDEQYNNGGYMLLRYFIDQVVDGGLLAYLQDALHPEVYLSHEALLGRHSREPWYATQVTPYDRWINFEHYTGLASSPRAVAELGINYHLISGEAVSYGGVTEGCEVRNGGMPGSVAFGAQCIRGLTFALLFNGHQEGGTYGDLVEIIRDYALSLSDAEYQ